MASIVKRSKTYSVVYYEGEGSNRHQVWESGLSYFYLGVTEQPTKAPFFFIWWAVLPNLLMKKEPTSCEVSHRFIGSAS